MLLLLLLLVVMTFCPVLQPSSIRGLGAPWTYFLHLSLSSVIVTDSSTGSPVLVLMMLSIQAVRGLPLSVLFFSRPRSEGWAHHGRTFSIYPCPLSFCMTDSSTWSHVHQTILLDDRGTCVCVCVNNLPGVVNWQQNGRDSRVQRPGHYNTRCLTATIVRRL